MTGAILRPVSRALRRPARGQLRGGSGFEWALLGRGAASQVFLAPDEAVAPALQDHLREGRGGVLRVAGARGGLKGAVVGGAMGVAGRSTW